MEKSIIILFLAIGGTMGLGIFSHCDIHRCDHLIEPEILEMLKGRAPNAEQLKDVCPPLIKVMECGNDMVKDCTGETIEQLAASENETVSQMASLFSNLMQLNYDVCDEDTDLHKNYVASIDCLLEMRRDEDTAACTREANKLYEAYRFNMPEPEEEETIEQIMAESNCMTTAYGMACAMIKTHKSCGDVAKDMFVEVVKRIQFMKLGFCSEGDLITLKTRFLDFLEEEGEQRDIFASAFDLRRKK